MKFLNGDLATDVKGTRADPKTLRLKDVRKDEFDNDGEILYTIEIHDNSYTYVNKEDRNKDYSALIGLIRKAS